MYNTMPNTGSRLAMATPSNEHKPIGHTAGGKLKASPRNVFIVVGIVLLVLVCIVPIWNSLALMQDANYSYWVGTTVPFWTIVLCVMIIVLYAITILTFFGHARPQAQTEQTIMMIANIFITLLGMMLMLSSLPLSRQSVETYNNLLHRCDFSEQTHRTYEYSQVLQNIRATPECASKYSVEECQGYQEAKPYTSFLKSMETNFRCSGFCYRSPAQLQAAVPSSASNTTSNVESLLWQAVSQDQRRHKDHVSPLALLDESAKGYQTASDVRTAKLNAKFAKLSNPLYPPTLFSDANYQASCEGMAARDMKNFAGDIGFQTFYQGIYLVMIAIATGFLKLLGFCARKDRDFQYMNNKASA